MSSALQGVGGGGLVRADLREQFVIFDADTDRELILGFAPTFSVPTMRVDAQKPITAPLLDERPADNPLVPSSLSGAARPGAVDWTNWSISLNRYAFGHMVLSTQEDAVKRAVGLDPEAAWMSVYVPIAWQIVARRHGVELATNGNYAVGHTSSSLSLASPGVDLQAALNLACRTFRNSAVGDRGLTMVVNDVVADAMLTLDQVQQGTAIASAETGTITTRRTGSINRTQLLAWITANTPIENVIILPTRTIRSNGSTLPALDNDIYLLKTGGALRPTFLHTALLEANLGQPGVPVSYPTFNPLGNAIYMDQSHGSALPDGRLGFRFSGVV
jgi:hypothetical protein